jgi:DNA-binding NarL/FixJ family response regulator/signal transduction histidine kinase
MVNFMLTWIKRTCFSNLELESQKNRLLLFLMFPLLILAEIDITINVPFLHPTNLLFVAVYLVFYAVCILLVNIPSLEKHFKYMVVCGMVVFSMFQIWLFSDYPVVYQIMYVNLALSTLYLDGYFILFTGIFTAVLTALGFMFWKDAFFPEIPVQIANIPIILVLQTAMVLWGAAKIGAHLKHSLHAQEQQLLLINERNRALRQHAEQVEKLTILEERNRISREMHDTIGYTLTSMIAGLEKLKASLPGQSNIDDLLLTARTGLEDIRAHIHMSGSQDEQLSFQDALRHLTEQFSRNTGARVDVVVFGRAHALPAHAGLVFLRCTQESLTNAVRHGAAKHIRIALYYEEKNFAMRIEDDGTGADHLAFGFGLKSMQSRIQGIKGSLHVSARPGQGFVIELRAPVLDEFGETSRRIRIMIMDDHTLIAESFATLLELEPDMEVVGVVNDGQEALAWSEQHQPDLILMDLHMPGMDGVEATRRIKEKWPQLKIVILTTFQETSDAARAIAHGAEGYLLKSVPPKQLADTIRLVQNGGTLIPAEIARQLIGHGGTIGHDDRIADKPSPVTGSGSDSRNEWLGQLTETEREMLRYLSRGLTYKEIASAMHYSEGTVKNYVSILYSKLNVKNRMQAVNKYQQI